MDDLNLMIWRIQAERFKLRGSEVKELTYHHSEAGSLLERVDEALSLDLEKVPPSARPALERMREILKILCFQVEPLLTEYEALILALTREGPPPPSRTY